MIPRKLVLVIAAFMVLYCVVSPGLAVPAAEVIQILEQKDGSAFTARMWGDEWLHGWETTEGYSIIFDATTQDWMYAIPGTDGSLVSSANVVGISLPPDNVPVHLRPTGKAELKSLI